MCLNRWIDKDGVVYMYNRIFLSHKLKHCLAICNNIDGHTSYDAKWSKSDKEKQIPYDLIHMWNLKILVLIKKKTKWNKKWRDGENRTDQWFPVGKGVGSWQNGEEVNCTVMDNS